MPSIPESLTFHVADETGLAALAAAVAAALPAHAFVALRGDLGAGKTTFVKAVAASVGIDPRDVVSPTFGLIHVHHGAGDRQPLTLVHADLYRLTGPEELGEIGWDDALAARPGTLLWAFVEWPERIIAALPPDRLDVTIAITSETGRRLEVCASGPVHGVVLGSLRGDRSLSSLVPASPS